jgi:hypothetical protein
VRIDFLETDYQKEICQSSHHACLWLLSLGVPQLPEEVLQQYTLCAFKQASCWRNLYRNCSRVGVKSRLRKEPSSLKCFQFKCQQHFGWPSFVRILHKGWETTTPCSDCQQSNRKGSNTTVVHPTFRREPGASAPGKCANFLGHQARPFASSLRHETSTTVVLSYAQHRNTDSQPVSVPPQLRSRRQQQVVLKSPRRFPGKANLLHP